MLRRTSTRSVRYRCVRLLLIAIGLVSFVVGLKLVNDYFAADEKDFLTIEERHWLRDNGESIVLATDPRWQPDKAVEDQRIYEGLIADFTTLLEHKLGMRFRRLRARYWVDVLDAEMKGEVDIHPVLIQSPERDKDWLFTDPYIRIPVVVVMRAAMKEKFSPQAMKTMRMGVGYGYGMAEFVDERCEGFNIVPVESDRFGLIKASLGEIDLMVTDLASAAHYIEKEGLTNLRLAATMGSLYEFRLASRRDKPVLHEILKKALAQISRREREEIYQRWITFDTTPFFRSPQFWSSAAVAGVSVLGIVGAILGWNISLKRQVMLMTGDLRNELAERRRAEKALGLVHASLERRVDERTMELACANEALQKEIKERAEMARDILRISSGERARIGRDLHDSISQQLVGVSLWARTLDDQLAESQPEDAELAKKISTELESAIDQTRFIVKGLLPVDIMQHGLVAALDHLVRDASRLWEIDCTFSCDNEEACRIEDNSFATNLYRIAQEGVNNACKHSKATSVTVSLHMEGNRGEMRVKDNGTGIVKRAASRGMGLRIMRYRAEIAGGGLEVCSVPDAGTEIICRFERNPELAFAGADT